MVALDNDRGLKVEYEVANDAPPAYEKLIVHESDGIDGINQIAIVKGAEIYEIGFDFGIKTKEEAVAFLKKYKDALCEIPEIKEFVENTYKSITEKQGAKA